jgi:hypothetical protein
LFLCFSATLFAHPEPWVLRRGGRARTAAAGFFVDEKALLLEGMEFFIDGTEFVVVQKEFFIDEMEFLVV